MTFTMFIFYLLYIYSVIKPRIFKPPQFHNCSPLKTKTQSFKFVDSEIIEISCIQNVRDIFMICSMYLESATSPTL